MEHEDRALMLVLTGEPLTPQDRDDPETVAAHAAAEADVALLGEQLREIGDALAAARVAPETGPVPAPTSTPRTAPALLPVARPRRRLRLALGALATAGAFGFASVVMWLGAQPGDQADSGASDKSASDAKTGGAGQENADLTPEGFVACSRLMVEGTVDRVTPEPGGKGDRITLTVIRYYKPATGPVTVRFRMDRDIDPHLKKGDRTLITIPKGGYHPDNWATGKAIKPLRDMIVKALPGSRGLKCDQGGRPDL
ncbi:hypothetical protein ACFRAO_33705 [Streptomyces sp. NPDC056656]|uniref:hypothetical protein n=1 Tax=Streptomyces sp. NPDC056656 TaxID=3345895 RepID=UPI0036A04E0A